MYNSFYRHAIGLNQTLVSCAVGHFFGTFERCMTKNKLDYGSIIAGNLECHTDMRSIPDFKHP